MGPTGNFHLPLDIGVSSQRMEHPPPKLIQHRRNLGILQYSEQIPWFHLHLQHLPLWPFDDETKRVWLSSESESVRLPLQEEVALPLVSRPPALCLAFEQTPSLLQFGSQVPGGWSLLLDQLFVRYPTYCLHNFQIADELICYS